MKTSFTEESTTKSNTNIPFMKFHKGSNVIRIITSPYKSSRYLINKSYVTVPFGTTLPTDVKMQTHWYVGIIDRRTQASAILDFGPAIYNKIAGFAKDADWGNIETYDIDVVMNPDGGADNYYNCVPKPKKPLSAHDLVLQEQFDENLLDKFANPTEEYFLSQFNKHLTNGQIDSKWTTERT